MSRKLILAAMLAVTTLLSGCASVDMASPEADEQAKTFAVRPGLANIYLYRNTSVGGALTFDIELDGKVIGQTAPNTFMLLTVRPGKHVIVSIGESESTVEVDTVAGQNYFVHQDVKQGVYAMSARLRLVDAATGRSGVEECHLATLHR